MSEVYQSNYKIHACRKPRLTDTTVMFSQHEVLKVVVMKSSPTSLLITKL